MELGLKGKVAVITGASKGIGKAIARSLAAEGSAVALCARDKGELARTAEEIAKEGIKALTVSADLTQPTEAKRLIQETIGRFGRIDILVNNLGGPLHFASFLELTDDDWKAEMELDLMVAVRMCREAVPFMQRQGGGRIINIASELALQPDGDMPHYAAAKAAILNLTKNISKAYALDGILINAVSPGMIATPAVEEMATETAKRMGITAAEVLTRFVTKRRPHLALRRPGQADEVAAVVLFLASEAASYITGTNIRVDGGSVAGV